MAQLCHFYSIPLSEARRMTLAEFFAFQGYMERYLAALKRR